MVVHAVILVIVAYHSIHLSLHCRLRKLSLTWYFAFNVNSSIPVILVPQVANWYMNGAICYPKRSFVYINVKIMLILHHYTITWYCIGIWSIYVFTSMFFVPLARILWWRTFVKGSLVCYTNLCFGVLYMINVYLSFFQNICLAGRGCCTWCKPKA